MSQHRRSFDLVENSLTATNENTTSPVIRKKKKKKRIKSSQSPEDLFRGSLHECLAEDEASESHQKQSTPPVPDGVDPASSLGGFAEGVKRKSRSRSARRGSLAPSIDVKENEPSPARRSKKSRRKTVHGFPYARPPSGASLRTEPNDIPKKRKKKKIVELTESESSEEDIDVVIADNPPLDDLLEQYKVEDLSESSRKGFETEAEVLPERSEDTGVFPVQADDIKKPRHRAKSAIPSNKIFPFDPDSTNSAVSLSGLTQSSSVVSRTSESLSQSRLDSDDHRGHRKRQRDVISASSRHTQSLDLLATPSVLEMLVSCVQA
ncbi:hypothetical protein ACOMHN_050253 [Nucella lapillus]